jgi:Arc-like DNA binding domain
MKDATRLNLRFEDEELRRQIEEAAKVSCRSRNGEIIVRLRASFAKPEEAAA